MHQLAATTVPRLGVLGGFELSVGPRPLTVSRSAQRLLGFLAVHRAPVRRTVVSGRLWTGSDGRHASSNLRSTLWRLPKPHGRPLVTTDGDHVALAEHVHVDLWTTEERARRLTAQPLDAAAAELRDDAHERLGADLLPDWSDDWLLVEREAYRQLRLHALEQLSAMLCGQQRYSEALHAALTAVEGEPLRESAHRHVIAVHLAEGNPAEALRQFHAYRRLLAAELGLPPSPAIRQLVGPLLGRPLDSRAPGRARSRRHRSR